MPPRKDPTFRATSYLRLLAVELSGALILAALAFLPLLLLKVLFAPAFYGMLVSVLALSLLITLLRWVAGGAREVEVDESGFLLRQGRNNPAIRVARTEIREVRVRRARIVITSAASPADRRPARLVIRRDGFPAADFLELGRRLSDLHRRP